MAMYLKKLQWQGLKITVDMESGMIDNIGTSWRKMINPKNLVLTVGSLAISKTARAAVDGINMK